MQIPVGVGDVGVAQVRGEGEDVTRNLGTRTGFQSSDGDRVAKVVKPRARLTRSPESKLAHDSQKRRDRRRICEGPAAHGDKQVLGVASDPAAAPEVILDRDLGRWVHWYEPALAELGLADEDPVG